MRTWQVLAGQKDMVRFFVTEKRLLPIDVRAVHSGHTPLLSLAAYRSVGLGLSLYAEQVALLCRTSGGQAVIGTIALHALCRCRWDETSNMFGPWQHSCGMPPEAAPAPSAHRPNPMRCRPLTDMATMLVDLGADLRATDAYGNDIVAVAAEAGDHGFWDSLMTWLPDAWDRCSPPAPSLPLYNVSHIAWRAPQEALSGAAAQVQRTCWPSAPRSNPICPVAQYRRAPSQGAGLAAAHLCSPGPHAAAAARGAGDSALQWHDGAHPLQLHLRRHAAIHHPRHWAAHSGGLQPPHH